MQRIDALFDIERDINGHDAEARRTIRQALSAPLVVELHGWLSEQRMRLARGNDVTRAIDYPLKRWAAFTRFLNEWADLHQQQGRRTRPGASPWGAGRGCSAARTAADKVPR